MHEQDIENIRLHIYLHLRPFKRRSLKSQFKLNINEDLYNLLKKEHQLTGRFSDAHRIIAYFGLPTSRLIEPGKSSTVNIFQARLARGKRAGGFIGKPWIVIRFIRGKDF